MRFWHVVTERADAEYTLEAVLADKRVVLEFDGKGAERVASLTDFHGDPWTAKEDAYSIS